MLQFRDQLKYFEKNLPGLPQMGIQAMGLMTVDELKQQLIDLVFARACLQEPWPQNAEQFKSACAEAKSRLGLLAQEICRLTSLVLTEWQALMKKLPAFKAHTAAVKDIEQQAGRLMHKRFVSQTPFERLQHYPRYLKAVALRLDKLKADPARDSRLMVEYAPLWTNYERRTAMLAKQGVVEPQLEQFRWLLEELRVALFAQELKTPTPVSSKRLQKTWEGIAHG
jgi:ATP-dependent helicase HrpA